MRIERIASDQRFFCMGKARMLTPPLNKSSVPKRGVPALIECSIRVSATLARLIHKAADREASGLSAREALLLAAGIPSGEFARLHQAVEKASAEAMHWREEANGKSERLRTADSRLAESDQEVLRLRENLKTTTDALEKALQQASALMMQISEMEANSLRQADRLANSLSLEGFDPLTKEVVVFLYEHIASHEAEFSQDSLSEIKSVFPNMARWEFRALNNFLIRRDWRVPLIRWLLKASVG
jgi:hypothetical protein